MKNKQAFFVNQMWNPFMLVELNIINGELPKYPINDSPPKKNIGRVSHMLIMRTLFIYFKKYIEPTQHINQPKQKKRKDPLRTYRTWWDLAT